MPIAVNEETSSKSRSLHMPSIGTASDNNDAYSILARRAMRLPREAEKLVYEMTADPALVHQYCVLREDMFIRVWGLKHFSGVKEPLDDLSHIVIARQGRQCIGGGRITFSYPGERLRLPMEETLNLNAIFPELHLTQRAYCEVTRLAILPEFQGGEVLSEIISSFIRKIIAENVEYGFFLAPLPLARNYRKVVKQLGFGWTIHNITVPDREEYEGIKMVISSMDFTGHVKKRVLTGESVTGRQAELAEA